MFNKYESWFLDNLHKIIIIAFISVVAFILSVSIAEFSKQDDYVITVRDKKEELNYNGEYTTRTYFVYTDQGTFKITGGVLDNRARDIYFKLEPNKTYKVQAYGGKYDYPAIIKIYEDY